MSSRPVLVLGVGNPLMGDDGIGLELLERLRAGYRVGDDVQLVDGGTWGMNLLPLIEQAGTLLLLDAIDGGRAPGELVVLEAGELPRQLSHKLSPHQIDLAEILALCLLRGTLPGRAMAIGVQPATVAMGLGLSPVADAGLAPALSRVARQLRDWGHDCEQLAASCSCMR